MTQSDDYAQNQIPDIFLEPVQAGPAARDSAAGGVSRGQLAMICFILFGALVATSAGLMMVRSGDQAEWSRTRQKLEAERVAAVDRASSLSVVNTQLSEDLGRATAKVEKYGPIEYQLNLIREKAQQIVDLRRAKPSYPDHLYMNVTAIPEWASPGETLLKDFVARLDGERSKLIAFKEPNPPTTTPTAPHISPTARPAAEQPR